MNPCADLDSMNWLFSDFLHSVSTVVQDNPKRDLNTLLFYKNRNIRAPFLVRLNCFSVRKKSQIITVAQNKVTLKLACQKANTADRPQRLRLYNIINLAGERYRRQVCTNELTMFMEQQIKA